VLNVGESTVLMQRTKGTTARTHEQLLLATDLRQTMENELLKVAKGFRVMGQMIGSGLTERGTNGKQFVAVLERPLEAREATRPEYQYLLLSTIRASTIQRELQEAADRGYRLLPGDWQPTLLLEKAPEIAPTEYLVLSATKIGTIQQEMNEASAHGYHFVSLLRADRDPRDIFGGTQRLTAVMERRKGMDTRTHEQLLLATFSTKTMERELIAELRKGFRLVGRALTLGNWWETPQWMAIIERRVQ